MNPYEPNPEGGFTSYKQNGLPSEAEQIAALKAAGYERYSAGWWWHPEPKWGRHIIRTADAYAHLTADMSETMSCDRLMTQLREKAKEVRRWSPSIAELMLEAESRLDAVSCMQPIPQRKGDSTVSYSEMQRRLHGLSK